MRPDDEDPAPPKRPKSGGRIPSEGTTFQPSKRDPNETKKKSGTGRASREPRPEVGGPTWMERIVFGSVSTAHLASFCRQFAAYLDAGVDLVKSLSSLEQQFARTALGPVIGRIQLSVRRGEALADAFTREKQAFDPLFLSLMHVAEARGDVPETLRNLAQHYEARLRLFRQARSAMIYPVIVVLVASVVIGILTMFVLPVMASLLLDLGGRGGGQLPLPSRVLIWISQFMQKFGWFAVPAGLVGGAFLLLSFYRTAGGKAIMDEIALYVPVLSSLLRKIDTTRFARTLGALLDGGVDIGSSLDLTASVMQLVPYRKAVARAREAVSDGTELSEALRASHRFGPDVIAIVSSGEDTGKLPESLERLADDYEEQVAYMVKNLGHLIQPLIMIFLGAIVLFIILAVILPYVAMISSLTR